MNLVALATHLSNSGVSARLIDLCIHDEWEKKLTSVLDQAVPSIVAIGSYSPTHLSAVKVARKIREHSPDILVVKGGIHETFVPFVTLENHDTIDVTVEGFGEEALVELSKERGNRSAWTSIPGISFRDRDGSIVRNRRKSLKAGATLDSFSIPNRSFLENCDYYDFAIFGGRRTAQVITTRGCPYQCSFCPASKSSTGAADPYRWRTSKHTELEVDQLLANNYGAIFFDDSVFTLNSERVSDLCSMLSGTGLQWACQTRLDCVDSKLLERMRSAGCSYIFFGLEAADDGQLQLMQKDLSAEVAWQAIDDTISLGFSVGASIILGHPGGGDEKVIELLSRLARYDARQLSVSLSMYALYPGTTDWLRALECGQVSQKSYEKFHSLEPIWNLFDEGRGAIHLVSSDEAERLHKLAKGILGSNRLFDDLPSANMVTNQ